MFRAAMRNSPIYLSQVKALWHMPNGATKLLYCLLPWQVSLAASHVRHKSDATCQQEKSEVIKTYDRDYWPGSKYLNEAKQIQADAPQKDSTHVDSVLLNPSLLLDKVMAAPSRDAFHSAIAIYANREGKFKKGSVAFVNSCIERMSEAKISPTLETYNLLLHVFPEGRYVTRNLFDVLWPQYNDHVVTGLRILQLMEDNQICPDVVTYDLVEGIYGKSSVPLRKLKNMAYWFLEFGIVPSYDHGNRKEPRITNKLHRAILALRNMGGSSSMVVVHRHGVENDAGERGRGARSDEERDDSNRNSKEDGSELANEQRPFVVSMQTEQHRDALEQCSPASHFFTVQGPHTHWFDRTLMPYATLSVVDRQHSSGAVCGVCVMETADRDSLAVWLDDIVEQNPHVKGMDTLINWA